MPTPAPDDASSANDDPVIRSADESHSNLAPAGSNSTVASGTSPAALQAGDGISTGDDAKDLGRLAAALLIGSLPVFAAWMLQIDFVFRLPPVLIAIAVLVFASEPLISSSDPNKDAFKKAAQWAAIVIAAAGVVSALIEFSGYPN